LIHGEIAQKTIAGGQRYEELIPLAPGSLMLVSREDWCLRSALSEVVRQNKDKVAVTYLPGVGNGLKIDQWKGG
jgi:hypothetical protein